MTSTREDIINSMCLTFRHDYGFVITEDDRMYSLAAGITEGERRALFSTMAQVYDHHFSDIVEDYHKVNAGETIIMPKSKDHANAMILVAEHYLKSHE